MILLYVVVGMQRDGECDITVVRLCYHVASAYYTVDTTLWST